MSDMPHAKNIILFMSNQVMNNIYWNRITKYFQPKSVKWNFAAGTAHMFTEITQNPAVVWDFLLTDLKDALQNQELLERFIKDNPGVVVGIIYKRTPPVSVPLTNAIMFESPTDIDEWLLMMYTLLK